jgi:O-acetyl-ADP-ribose deacetylase (regulator of RNase III)
MVVRRKDASAQSEIIHTVSRFYRDGRSGELQILESCYKRCFELAHEKGLKTIAFPFVGTGLFICPIEEASKIALTITVEHLKRFPDIEKVFFVLFSDSDLEVYRKNLETV